MARDVIKEHWVEIRMKMIQQWSKFSNDDVENIKGNYEELEHRLQKTYGYQKEEAQCHINDFLNRHGWRVKDEPDNNEY